MQEAVDPRQNLQTVGWKKTSSVALVIALIGPDRKVLIIGLDLLLIAVACVAGTRSDARSERRRHASLPREPLFFLAYYFHAPSTQATSYNGHRAVYFNIQTQILCNNFSSIMIFFFVPVVGFNVCSCASFEIAGI